MTFWKGAEAYLEPSRTSTIELFCENYLTAESRQVYGQKSPIEDVRLCLKMLFRKFPVVRIYLKQLLCSYCFPIAPTHSLHGLHFVDDCCGNVYDVGSGFRSLYADIITQKFTIWSYTEPCQISKMSF